MWQHSLIKPEPPRYRARILQLMAGVYVLGVMNGVVLALLFA